MAVAMWNDSEAMINQSISEPPPTLATLDYAEIALLVVLVSVGGPLNLYSLYRTVDATSNRRRDSVAGTGFYQADSSETQRKRSVFEILHNVTRRTSSLLQGAAIVKPDGSRSVSRLLTLRLHLTLANSLIIWLYAFSQICWLSTYEWKGGDVICRLTMFIHAFCFYATSNLVAMIAVDRLYVAFHINKPFSESSIPLYNLPACLCACWMLAFLCSSPQLFLWQAYEPFPNQWPGWTQCVSFWTAKRYDFTNRRRSSNEALDEQVNLHEKIYNMLHLALVFWIPAIIIVFSYALIMSKFHYNIRKNRRRFSVRQDPDPGPPRKTYGHRVEVRSSSETYTETPVQSPRPLRHRSTGIPGRKMREVPRTPASTVAVFVNPMQRFVCGPVVIENNAVITLRRAKRRTAKKSFWILFSYVICWSPYNILAVWRFIGTKYEWEFLEFMYNLIVLNAVLNPLIYGL